MGVQGWPCARHGAMRASARARAPLQFKGSLFATRPTLNHYTATRADLLMTANDLFGMVGSGKVTIPVNQTYALKDAQQAHRDLEGRKTTGSTVLVPG